MTREEIDKRVQDIILLFNAFKIDLPEAVGRLSEMVGPYDELREGVQKLAHRWDARSQGAARDVTEYNVMTTFRECAEQLQALIPGGDQGHDPEGDE